MTEKLLAAMRFYGRETAVCSCWQITERDGETTERSKLGLHKKGSELVFDRDGLWNTMLLLVWETSSMECPWNKLYVRKIIEDNGIRFPLELSLGEDFVFNLEYFRHCNGLVFLNEPLYYYRVVENSQSLTCRARPDFLQTMCSVEDALRASVKAHHELDEEERQILADHFTSRLCTGFLHLSTRCGEMMAKRQIAEIVRARRCAGGVRRDGRRVSEACGVPGARPAVRRRRDRGGVRPHHNAGAARAGPRSAARAGACQPRSGQNHAGIAKTSRCPAAQMGANHGTQPDDGRVEDDDAARWGKADAS